MKLVFSTVLFSLLFGATSVSAAWDEGGFGLRGGNGQKTKSFMLLGGEGGGETWKPTEHPTPAPTHQPTPAPTNRPTESPTDNPTTAVPTPAPSEIPSTDPTNSPTQPPSSPPTTKPTTTPSESPSLRPSSQPTMNPSESPSVRPSVQPTMKPTTTSPSESPSIRPSYQPTNPATSDATNEPTPAPTLNPTDQPTLAPTKPPTLSPTEQPIPDPTSPPTMAPEECLSLYDQDICMKMERLAGGIGQQEGNTDDIIITGQEGTNLIEEFNTVIKQSMKELRPINQHKQNFKDVALTAIMAEGNGKDKKEMLLEIASGLDSADMRERILTDIHNGYSVPEEGVAVDPTAGSEEAGFPGFVEDPMKPEYIEELGHPGNRRHLGVPLKGVARGAYYGDLWPSAIIEYYVVLENNGYLTWLNHILPAMNELEQETGLTFRLLGGVRDVSQATANGKLYVMNKYNGCWAHVGYHSSSPTSMNIDSGCERKGIVLHELLHVAGMMHQHEACYRDKYITVHNNWIQPAYLDQFYLLPCDNHGYEVMYDLGSIMHYGEYAFTKTLNINGVEIRGDKTIDCGGVCGQREGLSYFDGFELMLHYRNAYGVNHALRDGLGPIP